MGGGDDKTLVLVPHVNAKQEVSNSKGIVKITRFKELVVNCALGYTTRRSIIEQGLYMMSIRFPRLWIHLMALSNVSCEIFNALIVSLRV